MSLPFWDKGAINLVTTRDPSDPRKSITAEQPPSGITSLVPPVRFPYPDELSPWDVIYLNGVRAPGICRVEGGRHLALDIKRIIGQALPNIAIMNFDPVPIVVVLTLWTPEHFEELQDLIPQILPPASPNPVLRAVRAEHPALDLIGAHSLLFQAMDLPRHVGKGIVEVSFQTYEFNPDINLTPADSKTPIPQGLQPGATTSNPPTPPSQTPIPPG